MDVVAPSEAAVEVLRAISRAGFAYAPTRALGAAAGWELVDDEPDIGYVRYTAAVAGGPAVRRPVAVQLAGAENLPAAGVPLFAAEDYEETREPLDRAFRALAEQLAGTLGAPSRSGTYTYPHRPGWPYSFAGWALADATLVLVQDEFDIQFGMDVTLWVLAAGSPAAAPVPYE